jgi:predicted naringenin-chalcone synthase
MEGKTKVTIFTTTYRVKGYIDLLPGARVTDFMAEAKDFIAMVNAEVWELHPGGRQVAAAAFLDVSRDHIEIILPGH